MTGLPGREKTMIAACRPVMTSGSGRIRAGSTAQPKWSACHRAQASAISAAARSLR